MRSYGIHDIKVTDYVEREFYIDEEMGKKFAEISGDFNPIHLDKKYADGTMFNGKIVHGMLVASFISGVIGNDFPGEGTIYMKQDLQFVQPVRYGDTIKVHVEAISVNEEKARVTLKTECFNQHGENVITGTALVMVRH